MRQRLLRRRRLPRQRRHRVRLHRLRLRFVKGTEYLDLIGGASSFFGITPEAFGAVGAMFNFIVAFAVDKVTKEPPERIQHMVESVRIPRGSKLVDGVH